MAAEHESSCQSILRFPEEVFEHILKSDNLDHNDLKNVSQACKYFHQICSSNELWKQKLQLRWPGLYDRYDRQVHRCWQDVYRQRLHYGRRIQHLVSGLSSEYYNTQEMSREGFAQFIVLMDEQEDSSNFIMDELMNRIHDGKKHEKLTEKYYCEKVLRHLHQIHMQGEWQQFLEMPPTEQNLEIGAVLIARWCQPTVCVTWNSVCDHLDNIATMVKVELGQRSPNHPASSMQLNTGALTEHMWSRQQCQAVLDAINTVLFEKLGFRGNDENYYDPHNSFINKVLEKRKGIPITLAILYSGIARRLGVLCEAVNFPSHFLLRWQETPFAPLDQMYKYIDVFHGGRFYQQKECCRAVGIPESLGTLEDNYKSVTAKRVLERMARNLVGIGRHQSQLGDGLLCLRNALDLFLIICPDDLEMRLLQVRINLHLNINLPDVMDSLQHVADLDPTRMGLVAYLLQEAEMQMKDNNDNGTKKEKVKQKLRKNNPEVKFSVGMVMKHKRYDYTCVIFGWDETCQASEEWIIQMGVHNLPKKHQQPFYNVLVDDGSNRYAAQENMLYTDTPREISHPEVGRYFQTFMGTHYDANEEKQNEYPDDTEVTQALVHEYYGER